MLLTALNLFPAGELDGGRIAHALLPRHGARAADLLATTAAAVLSTQSNMVRLDHRHQRDDLHEPGRQRLAGDAGRAGASRGDATAALAGALALCSRPSGSARRTDANAPHKR